MHFGQEKSLYGLFFMKGGLQTYSIRGQKNVFLSKVLVNIVFQKKGSNENDKRNEN